MGDQTLRPARERSKPTAPRMRGRVRALALAGVVAVVAAATIGGAEAAARRPVPSVPTRANMSTLQRVTPPKRAPAGAVMAGHRVPPTVGHRGQACDPAAGLGPRIRSDGLGGGLAGGTDVTGRTGLVACLPSERATVPIG
jgi:hypothetical protein